MSNQTILLNQQLCKSTHFYNSVRLMRRYLPPVGKPALFPPGGRKMFRAIEPPWQPPELAKEMMWRRQAYNNALQSMRRVFREEYETYMVEKTWGWPKIYSEERAELDRLIEENNERLRQGELRRAQKDKEDLEKLKNEFLSELEGKLAKDEEKRKEREAIIKEQIANIDHFITAENIEREISNALENPVVYDYCIDLNGKKFYDPPPMKYPTSVHVQKGRRFDRILAPQVIRGGRRREDDIRPRRSDIPTDETGQPGIPHFNMRDEGEDKPLRGRFARFRRAEIAESAVGEAIDLALSHEKDEVDKELEKMDTERLKKKEVAVEIADNDKFDPTSLLDK